MIPLMLIWVITANDFNDRKILFNIIIFGLYFRMILTVIFESKSIELDNRLGNMMHPNEIGFSSVVLIVFLYLKYIYKEYELKKLLLLLILPVYIIFAVASRNAFGALLILFVSHFLIHRSRNKVNNFTKLLIGTVIVLSTLFLVSKFTYLGQRLSHTTAQGSELNQPDYNPKGTIFEKFGDRGIFYTMGYAIFKEHPIRGIGLGNFFLFNGEYSQHSEYMIQLCETGIIGSFLFLLFYGWIWKSIFFCWKNDSNNRNITEAYLSGLVIILFMGLSTREYENPIVFIFLGTIIAYILNRKEAIDNRPASVCKNYLHQF
jgi:O-antigen ligase